MIDPAEPVIYSADQFWAILGEYGVELDDYTADGRSRFVRPPGGDWQVVSVHEQYPDYAVDRMLILMGIMPPPTYDNLN